MAPHLLLFGDRLAIAQSADSVTCHPLLRSGRLAIAQFADSAARRLLLCGGRLAIARFADPVAHNCTLSDSVVQDYTLSVVPDYMARRTRVPRL